MISTQGKIYVKSMPVNGLPFETGYLSKKKSTMNKSHRSWDSGQTNDLCHELNRFAKVY